jgi:hypothetical protein
MSGGGRRQVNEAFSFAPNFNYKVCVRPLSLSLVSLWFTLCLESRRRLGRCRYELWSPCGTSSDSFLPLPILQFSSKFINYLRQSSSSLKKFLCFRQIISCLRKDMYSMVHNFRFMSKLKK